MCDPFFSAATGTPPPQCFSYVLDPWRHLATKSHMPIVFGYIFATRPSHPNNTATAPSTVKNLLFWRQGPSPPRKLATRRHILAKTPAVAALCTFGACEEAPYQAYCKNCWWSSCSKQQQQATRQRGPGRVFFAAGCLATHSNGKKVFGYLFGENGIPLNFIWLQNLAKIAMQFCPISQWNYLKIAKFGESAN